jgi:hypothetical protein
VFSRLQLRKAAMQLQKSVLRYFLGQRAVVQQVVGDAEHHRLVLPDDRLELTDCLRFRHSGFAVCVPLLTSLIRTECRLGTQKVRTII